MFDRLVGTRIAAASVEVRAPLLGTREFGLIDAPFLPTEIFAFADAGAAWTRRRRSELDVRDRHRRARPGLQRRRRPAHPARYIPIEIYAAKPFQRPDEDIVYGFNIIPGW